MKIYDITGIGANLTGSFSGSFKEIFTGTATTASYVQYSNVADKPTLISGSSQIADFGYATTGSNQFDGSQAITGSLTVTGQVVAQTLNVQQVTSSIVYSSGSNIFGNDLGNTQQFTGSVSVTGSLAVAGVGTFAGSVTATIFDSTSNAFRFNGSNALSLVTLNAQNVVKINAAGYWGVQLVGANDQGILINNSGNVSIGNNSPEARLHVTGTVEANGSLYRAVFGGTSAQDADLTGISGGNGSEVQIQSPSTTRGAFLTIGGGMAFGEAMGGISFYNSNNVDGKRNRAFIVGAQEGATAGEQGSYLSFGTVANTVSVPSERMRITSGGDLSFKGRSTTTNLEALFYNDNSQFAINASNTNVGKIINFNHRNDITAMSITSGGNVLIGPTSNIASSRLRIGGNLQIDGFQKMYTYYIIVQPNTTGTVTISSPTGTNMQGSMQVMAGGYGNSLSGNVTGLWMVGGLLFFNNDSTSTITQIVNSVTANGSMSFQRSSDQYTVTLANTSSTQTKTLYVSVIINGD